MVSINQQESIPVGCSPPVINHTCFITNKLEHFGRGWGVGVYSEVQVEQVWTCPGGPFRGARGVFLYGEVQSIIVNGHMPVALLANCNYTQSEIRNVLTTIHSFSSSSEWLKDNVSMNFPIDTIASSYVWSALRTLEWLSQVLRSHIQLNAIVTYCTEWHLRVILCLLFNCCICI